MNQHVLVLVIKSAIKATGHKETYTKIEKYPTCENPGVTKEYCKKCNAYIKGKDGTIPATGIHNFKWEISVPVTCTGNGEDIRNAWAIIHDFYIKATLYIMCAYAIVAKNGGWRV